MDISTAQPMDTDRMQEEEDATYFETVATSADIVGTEYEALCVVPE